MAKATLPVRQFRCRLEELGPLNDMVKAMFGPNEKDFGKVSPDYGQPDFLKTWGLDQQVFADLVPTGVRRATDEEVTKEMRKLSKSLREPLNWLNIRLNRAEKNKALGTSAEAFGLGKVRTEITTSDMEGLDGALNNLLHLLQEPANAPGLASQGHTAADTQAFVDARAQIATFNTDQNTNQNASLELTEENIKAGSALWAHIADVLETGQLLYRGSNPKKAKTFTLAALLKRVRQEKGHSGGEDAKKE